MGKSNNIGEENQSNNDSEVLLTVKEVAVIIEESTDVVRNWIKVLKNHIPLHKNESGYNVFNNEALETMKLIKELHRERNYSMKQIEHYFNTDGKAFIPTPKQSSDELLANELKLIHEELKLQKEFNKALLDKLDQQQQYLENRLNERDKRLMENIRELQEQKQIAATIEQPVEKKSFLARLFGR